jgi:leucyl/phenylalanyl-tRNA--protein transferase
VTRSRICWLSPDAPAAAFPDIELALDEPDGLLAAGGDLQAERLLCAYERGIFPWYEEGQPILWWSPDPRCVIKPEQFHYSRSLRRALRTSDCELRSNTSFAAVIAACAEPRREQAGTWITDDMIAAFCELHENGWAHSLEVWHQEQLLGGIYGIAIGRVFFGESMFSRISNASKFAVAGLTRILARERFALLDCQVISPHLLSLGATCIPRSDFGEILKSACPQRKKFENWPNAPIKVSELAE